MRPPDENQPGSTRPNFTSSARRSASGDDNILARLERDARRGRVAKQGWKHARLAWCLLASVAVIGLVGALASLTRENLSASRTPVLIEARSTPPDISGPSAAALVKGGFAPLPAPDIKLAAAVADLPPDPVKPPPMVMLKPAPAAPAKSAAAPAPKLAAKRVQAKPVAKTPPVKIAVAKPAPFDLSPSLSRRQRGQRNRLPLRRLRRNRPPSTATLHFCQQSSCTPAATPPNGRSRKRHAAAPARSARRKPTCCRPRKPQTSGLRGDFAGCGRPPGIYCT